MVEFYDEAMTRLTTYAGSRLCIGKEGDWDGGAQVQWQASVDDRHKPVVASDDPCILRAIPAREEGNVKHSVRWEIRARSITYRMRVLQDPDPCMLHASARNVAARR